MAKKEPNIKKNDFKIQKLQKKIKKNVKLTILELRTIYRAL